MIAWYFRLMIRPPKDKSADRFLDCQEAIESKLQALVAEAVESGWGEQETLSAVIETAENLVLGAQANDDVLRQIRRMTD